MICVEIWKLGIHKILFDYDTISGIAAGDIICIIELDDVNRGFHNLGLLQATTPKELHPLPVEFNFASSNMENRYRYTSAFAPPLLIWCPPVISLPIPVPRHLFIYHAGDEMYKMLVQQISRYSKFPLYRRVGSDIPYPIPPNLDYSPSRDTNWCADSDEWEPFPLLLKLFCCRGVGDRVCWYPIPAPEVQEESPKPDIYPQEQTDSQPQEQADILPQEQHEIQPQELSEVQPHERENIVGYGAPAEQSHDGPRPPSSPPGYVRPPPKLMSEFKFNSDWKFVMEFNQDLAMALFGEGIRSPNAMDAGHNAFMVQSTNLSLNVTHR
jgi:hypothetical protein